MASSTQSKRPFMGVTFDCCKVYLRVYRNAAGTAYEARCPRCYKQVRFVVGEGGSGTRFWTVR